MIGLIILGLFGFTLAILCLASIIGIAKANTCENSLFLATIVIATLIGCAASAYNAMHRAECLEKIHQK